MEILLKLLWDATSKEISCFLFRILITGKMMLENNYLCDTMMLALDIGIVQTLKRIFNPFY